MLAGMETSKPTHNPEKSTPSSEKPLLLLDVDGVLCPFGLQFRRTETGMVLSDTLDEYPGYEYNEDARVHISKDNVRRLAELAEHFEIHWCTGWLHAANEVIGPLHELPQLPVVDLSQGSWKDGHWTPGDPPPDLSHHYASGTEIHWKGSGIINHVGDRPYAFVDDDIHEHGLTYAQDRNTKIPTLWVKTDPTIGLTDEHVAQLIDWAESIR